MFMCNPLDIRQYSLKGVDHLQSNKSCQIVEQYLAYLVTISGRSKNTVLEYRLDLLQFYHFVDINRSQENTDFQFVNIIH